MALTFVFLRGFDLDLALAFALVFGLVFAATRDLDLFARTLASAKELVEGWGGRLHFCYLPDSVRYRGLLPADAAYETSKEAVLGVVRDLGINVMDVSARFERHPTPKSLFDKPGHHYTPEGAALAAETIAHGLPAEELLVQHSRR